MDLEGWVAAAAAILRERDRRHAATRLADVLLRATHARVGTRVSVVMTSDVPAVDVTVHTTDGQVPPLDVWRRDSLDTDHPFAVYYRDTECRRPHTLDQVRAAGYELTEAGRERLRRMNLTEHQLQLPLSRADEPYRGWTMTSDTPYTPADAAALESVQELVSGLDAFVEGLDTSPRPAADADIRLTAGESRVLAMMHAGLTAPAMAARLDVSPRTVHKHQENIYRKLGASDRLGAVLAAKRLGLLPGGEA